MSKKSPLQIVAEEHGSKAELAKKVLELLDTPEDEDDALSFENRINTMSNRKLLRLWSAHQLLNEKFGTRQELVDAIVKSRFTTGNEDYAAKLSTFTVPKLLDVARRQKLVTPAELRWRK